MAYDDQNAFAKILRKELPAAKVLETDGALAFLDIGPLNKGHLLVVPKAPAATLSELPDEAAAHVGALLPRLCRAVLRATGADGLNVIVNHGAVAGQSVDHVHWHIIPRFRDDGIRWPWPHKSYDEGEMEDVRARIEEALASS